VRKALQDQNYHPLGRNSRTVWEIATAPSKGTHVAPMPPKLAERCILAGSALGDCVLDPFGGTGTVGRAAAAHGRSATLVDLDERAVVLMGGAR
jgi:DNA modification methylase